MKPHEIAENVEDITERNHRVEAEKAWEVSWTRRIFIVLGTYLIVFLYLQFLGIEQAYLHALVPPGAFLASTLSFPLLKKIWVKNIYKARF